MISVNRLKESIYKDSYFSEVVGSLVVNNEEKPKGNVLSQIELQTKGKFICLSNKILKEGADIYKTEDKDTCRVSFRRDCDGICLLEVGGRNILLIIEVKSGFNDVKRKGFDQIAASYVKVRSILQSIEGYNPADYEELGLLVSYPPSAKPTPPSTSLIELKKETVAPSALERLNNAYNTKLRVDKEVTLNLNDYQVSACHINPSLYNPILHVKHVSVTDQVDRETINLDSYL